MANFIYNEFKEYMADNTIDLDGDTFNISLHGSNFVADSSHNQWSDITATQTSGTGYSDGGTSLSNVTWTRSGGVIEFDSDDPSWTTATFSADWAVLRSVSGTGSGYLVGAWDFGGSESVSGGTFTVQVNAAGFIQLS
jgi:hypothetical protein